MIADVFINFRTFTFLIAISNNIKLKPRVCDFIWQYWLRLYQPLALSHHNRWNAEAFGDILCCISDIYSYCLELYFYIKNPNQRCEFVQSKRPKLCFITSNINYNCTWKHIIQFGYLLHGYEFGGLVRNNLQT